MTPRRFSLGRFTFPLALLLGACSSSSPNTGAPLGAAGSTPGGSGGARAGSSGAPVEVTLPASRGVIAIPTWNMLGADGHEIESDGVVPDLPSVATPDALAAGDDVPLHAALDSVRSRLP